MQGIERFVHRCTHEQRAPCHRAHGAPDSAVRFIFNGVQLLESNTFESYGIKDGDSIIALPADQTDSIITTHQWLNLTRDSDTFNDCMRWMLDPRTSGEASRLRDLHLMKMERRPKVFMRMCAPFVSQEAKSTVPAATTSCANTTSEHKGHPRFIARK